MATPDEMSSTQKLQAYADYYDYDGDENLKLDPEAKILLAVFGLCFALGVAGNLMLAARRCRKQGGNMYIWSSMAADMILLLIVLPLIVATRIYGYWPFGSFACKSLNYLLVLGIGMSGLSLVIGACELRASQSGEQYRRCSGRWWMFLLVWVTVALACFPIAVLTGVHLRWEGGQERPFCQLPNQQGTISRTYAVGILLISFVFPITMTGVLVLGGKRDTKGTADAEACLNNDKKSPDVGTKITLCACLIMFSLCRLPTHLSQMNDAFMIIGSTFDAYWLGLLAQALFFLPCAVNPIVHLISRHCKSFTTDGQISLIDQDLE